ncbi:MAG: sensor histidine kinase [bacterium]|jgi:two-component system sensor histidine kinase DegS
MFNPVPDIATLDVIIKETIAVISSSKEQIYDIAEGAREEYRRLEQEVKTLQRETGDVIDQVDELEQMERKARWRLLEVSRDFHRYTEDDIRWAYEEAKNIQVELALHREREKLLRQRRDDLERSLRRLEETVNKAERLVSQVGVVMDYLEGSLGDLSQQLEGVQQRQQLAVGIIKAQEEERRRVAREIHDGPAQSLANLVFRIELCEKLLAGKRLPELQGELAELKGLIKGGLQEVRKIIFDLRPMALDDLGLVPALRRYLEGLEEREGLGVYLAVLGEEVRLASAVEVGLFRIIQEALHNVIKHARAASARVTLTYGKEQLLLSVKDDGLGFDLKEAEDRSREGGHFGLISMRERAELLGGQFEVISAPGQGTRIVVAVPITEGEEEWGIGTDTDFAGR